MDITSIFVCLLFSFSPISAVIYSIENPDGSYDTKIGNTGQSLFSLVTKSGGWTDETLKNTPNVGEYGLPPAESNPDGNFDGSYGNLRLNPSSLLRPHLEILSLVESFLKLKGEVASRIHAVIADNFDLISGVYNVVISKVAGLHSFSLTGIQILRRIIEFAVECIGQWQITVPSISFSGTHQSSGTYTQQTYGNPSQSESNFKQYP